jgi:Tfp pilus assembly protein FimV
VNPRPRLRRIAGLAAVVWTGAAQALGLSSAGADEPPRPPDPAAGPGSETGGDAESGREAPGAPVPPHRPSPPPAERLSGQDYTVVRGDTLWSIAQRVVGPDAGVDEVTREVERLWSLNADRIGTATPSVLLPGVVLRLR